MTVLRTWAAAGSEDTAVEFSGNLDITALGGAGFASQRTNMFVGDDGGSAPPLDLRGWDALVLVVGVGGGDGDGDGESLGRSGKRFTVVLKDTILPRRPDGRETSGVSWECGFDVGAGEFIEVRGGENEKKKKKKNVVLPFDGFKPTYRGKPVEGEIEPLDWGCVRRVGIMMRRLVFHFFLHLFSLSTFRVYPLGGFFFFFPFHVCCVDIRSEVSVRVEEYLLTKIIDRLV